MERKFAPGYTNARDLGQSQSSNLRARVTTSSNGNKQTKPPRAPNPPQGINHFVELLEALLPSLTPPRLSPDPFSTRRIESKCLSLYGTQIHKTNILCHNDIALTLCRFPNLFVRPTPEVDTRNLTARFSLKASHSQNHPRR